MRDLIDPSRLMRILAAVIGLLLVASASRADHSLGLPRYATNPASGLPFLEFPARAGPLEIMLLLPLPERGGPTTLVVYVRDSRRGRTYRGPVSLRLVERSALWADREVLPRTALVAEEEVFSRDVVLVEDTSYVAEIEVEIGDTRERIPFLIVVGGAGQPLAWGVSAAAIAIVVVAVVAIRAHGRA